MNAIALHAAHPTLPATATATNTQSKKDKRREREREREKDKRKAKSALAAADGGSSSSRAPGSKPYREARVRAHAEHGGGGGSDDFPELAPARVVCTSKRLESAAAAPGISCDLFQYCSSSSSSSLCRAHRSTTH